MRRLAIVAALCAITAGRARAGGGAVPAATKLKHGHLTAKVPSGWSVADEQVTALDKETAHVSIMYVIDPPDALVAQMKKIKGATAGAITAGTVAGIAGKQITFTMDDGGTVLVELAVTPCDGTLQVMLGIDAGTDPALAAEGHAIVDSLAEGRDPPFHVMDPDDAYAKLDAAGQKTADAVANAICDGAAADFVKLVPPDGVTIKAPRGQGGKSTAMSPKDLRAAIDAAGGPWKWLRLPRDGTWMSLSVGPGDLTISHGSANEPGRSIRLAKVNGAWRITEIGPEP